MDIVRLAQTLICCALVPVSVLAYDSEGLVPSGPLRITAVHVLILLIGVTGDWRLGLPGRFASSRFEPGRFEPGGVSTGRGLPGIALAFVAWLGLSTLVAVDPWHAVFGTPDRRFGLATWLLVVFAVWTGTRTGKRQAAALVRSAVVGSVLIGGLAVFHLLGWDPDGVGGRWTGLYGQPTYLGSASVFFGLIAAGVMSDRKQGHLWRWTGALGAVGCLTALVGSGTRGAMVGAAAGGLLIIYHLAKRDHLPKRGHDQTSPAGAVPRAATVTGAVFLVALVVAVVLGQGRSFSRLDEWRIAVKAIADAPLTGYGPEGYRVVFGQFVTEDYISKYGSEVFTDRAHAGLLDLALVGGLVAVALYCWFLFRVGRRVWMSRRNLSSTTMGIAAACVAYLVAQQSLFPIAGLEPVVALFLGVLLSQTLAGSARLSSARLSSGRFGTGRLRLGSQILIPSLVLVWAGTAGYLGAREIVAEHRLGVEASSASVDLEVVASAADLAPKSIRVRYAAAQLMARGESIFNLDAALTQLEKVLQVSPRDPALQQRYAELLVGRAQRSGSLLDIELANEAVGILVEGQPCSTLVSEIAKAADELTSQ